VISESTISQISDRLKMSEVAADYFPVKRSGSRFSALCPFHTEKTPSFTINDERGTWKCFGCAAGGSMFSFVQQIDGLSFPDAVRKLGKRAGVTVEEEKTPESEFRRGCERVIQSCESMFFDCLMGPAGKDAREELRRRGFNSDICKQWGIGFAPNDYPMEGNPDHLVGSGMAIPDNGNLFLRFRNRIMFSVRDSSGKTVGFSGRTTDGHKAKYLNTPETMMFRKGNLLFGLDKASRSIITDGQSVIVEGQIDVIKCHLAGVPAIAPLGTAFTDHHARAVRRLAGSAVLIFDADKAGQEAARKAFCALAPLGVDVRSVILPDGKDPDDFISSGGDMKQVVASAKNYVETLAESLVGNLDSPKARLDAATTIGFVLSRIDEDVIRDSIAAKIAPKLGVGVAEIKKQIAKASIDLHGKPDQPIQSVQQINEPLRNLIARLLYMGKGGADQFNWQLINDPAVHEILASDYEPGNQSAIAIILSRLDPSIESAIVDVSPENAGAISIHGCYVSLLSQEIKRLSERVGSGSADIMELCPLLDEIKKFNES